jgi:hypothetical protein
MSDSHERCTCCTVSDEEFERQGEALVDEFDRMLAQFDTSVLVFEVLELLAFIAGRSEDPDRLAQGWGDFLKAVVAKDVAPEESRAM